MMERSHLHSSMHGNNDDNITDDYLAMGGDGGNGGDGEEFYVLPPDFVPGKWDVICQRGKECFEHGAFLFVQRFVSPVRLFPFCLPNHLI